MRESIYRITLDVHSIANQVQITCKQNDSARKLIISLMENGKPYKVESTCRAVMMIKKPDGNILYNDTEITNSGSTVSYDFNSQTTPVTGLCECELRVYGDNNEVITSPRFTMLVSANVYQDGQVTSSSQYTALTQVMTSLNAKITEVDNALDDVDEALEEVEEALGRETTILNTAEGYMLGAKEYSESACSYMNTAKRMSEYAGQFASESSNYKDVSKAYSDLSKTSADTAVVAATQLTAASTGKLSNENLLDNPFFTINQRGGKIAPSGTTYYVDGGAEGGTLTQAYKVNGFTSDNAWGMISISGVTRYVKSSDVVDGYVGVQNGYDRWLTSGCYKDTNCIRVLTTAQRLEFDRLIDGKTYTFSFILDDDRLITYSGVVSRDNPNWILGGWITYDSNTSIFCGMRVENGADYIIEINSNSTNYYGIKCAKLELGTVSTLANDVAPNYATELMKCKCSKGDSTDTYANQVVAYEQSTGWTNATLGDNILYGSVSYMIKNGICFVQIINLTINTGAGNGKIIASGLPSPKGFTSCVLKELSSHTTPFAEGLNIGMLYMDVNSSGNLYGAIWNNGSEIYASFSYPI